MADLWELTKKAKAGDVEAQLAVAHAFETGEGVVQDIRKAFNWYKAAAENGDAEGYYRAGVCVSKLDPRNFTEITKWYFEAARIGHLEAQIKLAFGYHNHLSDDKQEETKKYWLTKAAEQGDSITQKELGIFYYDRQEYKNALFWFEQAVEQEENIEAKLYLAKCYQNGLGTEASPKKAFQLYREAAEEGSEIGMRELGKCYLKGIGTEEDKKEAFYWFKEGAELDDAESYYQLGRCYHFAVGTERDDEKGFEAFKEAVKWADITYTSLPDATFMIGTFFYHGTGVDVNYNAAVSCFEKAAEENHAGALYMMGECYFHGHGVRKNRKKALEYYHRADDWGCTPAALYKLGFCYQNGYGTEKNLLKAVYWYALAEEYHSAEAREELDKLLDRE